MRRVLETIGGLYELARLAVRTRGSWRGSYWEWRWHTALGPGPRPSRREMARAILAYGRWVHRMRRGL